jgi:hypothetical protein
MDFENFKAPYISYDDTRSIAQDFLKQYNTTNEMPVDIELIHEAGLGMNLIPAPLSYFGIEAFTSLSAKEIRYNEVTATDNIGRHRFTLAHEAGHIIMHEDIFKQVSYSSPDEFMETQEKFPPNQYSYLEIQADNFAGLVLVPEDRLEEQVELQLNKILNEGFDLKEENYELILSYVSKLVAKHFVVNEMTAQIRIERDEYDLREFL